MNDPSCSASFDLRRLKQLTDTILSGRLAELRPPVLCELAVDLVDGVHLAGETAEGLPDQVAGEVGLVLLVEVLAAVHSGREPVLDERLHDLLPRTVDTDVIARILELVEPFDDGGEVAEVERRELIHELVQLGLGGQSTLLGLLRHTLASGRLAVLLRLPLALLGEEVDDVVGLVPRVGDELDVVEVGGAGLSGEGGDLDEPDGRV